MRKRTQVIGGLVIATGIGLGASVACSNQLNDQGGVAQANPDYAVTVMNVDKFPNITMVCFDGVGFATTTRDNNDAAQRVPEWDAFCKTQQPATPHLVPGTGTTHPVTAPSSSSTP